MTATLIKLSGPMGKRFGREYRLHLDTYTPAEAIKALCSVIKGFRQYLASAHQRGIEFAIWRGAGASAENISKEQLVEPAGGIIRIAPVTKGAKNGGILTTIVGVVLVAAATYFSDGAATGSAAAAFWGGVETVGISMVAGGVVQMLSPQPKFAKSADSADNQASYIFNGPVNTTAQGNPVPVLYGRMIIGSAVISAGITAEEYSTAASTVGTGTSSGSSKKTPYESDE